MLLHALRNPQYSEQRRDNRRRKAQTVWKPRHFVTFAQCRLKERTGECKFRDTVAYTIYIYFFNDGAFPAGFLFGSYI